MREKRSRKFEAEAEGRRLERAGTGGGAICDVDGRSRSESYGYDLISKKLKVWV